MHRSATSLAAPGHDAHRGAARTAGARRPLLVLLRAFLRRLRYRPERHYMRGRPAASGPAGMVGATR